ncbi:MAG: hypothetical protein MN733_21290 [Nitrososphaera sp.]|nr:hypothetical protein [Nitrososphaera sp.]
MNNRPNNLVVLSAELDWLDLETNAYRTSLLRAELDAHNLQYVIGTGHYTNATAFVVQVPSGRNLEESRDLLRELGKNYIQDSILEIDTANVAYLVSFSEGREFVRPIGQWREVTAKEALGRCAYTLVDGRYFIAE